MQCGAPVITSNVSSLPEVVGNAAITIDPTDEGALGRAMIDVLTNSELAADLRRRGLERATRFTWGQTFDTAMAAYRRCLSSSS
jgi:glycosyltransferase involved in cell wall biosynthesis